MISWLTGYDKAQLKQQLQTDIGVQEIFWGALYMNKNRIQIKGSICGLKLEEIEETLMRDIRCLNKLVDELARRKQLASMLRG